MKKLQCDGREGISFGKCYDSGGICKWGTEALWCREHILETGRYIPGRHHQDQDWASPTKLGVTEENGNEYVEKG